MMFVYPDTPFRNTVGSVGLWELGDIIILHRHVDHGVCISSHLLGGSDLRYWQPFGVCREGLSTPVHTSRVLG